MAEQQKGASNYKEISEELGKRLVKLYGLKIFPRQGKVFADLLFQTGVEAGTAIAALADLEDKEAKLDLSNKAMVKLNQTAYIITVMREAGFYSKEEVMSVEEYVHGLIRAVKGLLAVAYAQRPARNGQPVQPVQHIQRIQHVHTYAGYRPAPANAKHVTERELAKKLGNAPVVKTTEEYAPVEQAEEVEDTAAYEEALEAAQQNEAIVETEASEQTEETAEEAQTEGMADGFNDPVE